MRSLALPVIFAYFTGVSCINFPFEAITLKEEDIKAFPAIAFGDKSTSKYEKAACKTQPGTPEWPVDDEWAKFNASLGGALLKPAPPAIVCYPGPLQNTDQCNYLLKNASSTRFYINDPVTVLTEWTEGDTCYATAAPTKNCTQGGFPSYVVNATTVKQIQIAVNFARNKNIRLIVKNTGHDFNGRSSGASSISVWTHYLKSFEFLPEYKQGEYKGLAARVGSGLEAWELYHYMDINNMTIVVPGGSTVGAYGGWMAGGGHSILSSTYGLGSDQPLSLQVVTADGRFVTADTDTNEDLYHALRGGGPGSYGIVTSAVVKAYPAMQVTQSTLDFSGGLHPIMSGTLGSGLPFSYSPDSHGIVEDNEIFWKGVSEFFFFGKKVVDAGGTTYNYVFPAGEDSYSFTTTFQFPGKTIQESFDFVQPLFTSLNAMGINATNKMPTISPSWGSSRQGAGDSPGNSRFTTRLFPYKNWENLTSYDQTMAAIRSTVEEGKYTFHGIHVRPTQKVAGYPGKDAVNPAFREAIMHADLFDSVNMRSLSSQEAKDTHTRLDSFMEKIRVATPGSGAYVNEADVQEPNFQQSFWGNKYARLLKIKKERDPYDVFWSPATVGSEGWEVKSADGLPTQNGPLCRVTK
ncbi:FAD binding domain-containing protein [Tricladium varicosporioides]|nr:FAD binding domain-containing protein [Hymenoscyphus varicosporioides]